MRAELSLSSEPTTTRAQSGRVTAMMEGGRAGNRYSSDSDRPRSTEHLRRRPPADPRKGAGYFSIESLLVLGGVALSLLILPLVLPPLPPPPLMLLLLPLGMLAVLLVLAFMPSDLREAASSYL